MKKLILALAILVGGLTASAKSDAPSDTIKVDNAKIERVIEDKTTNSKGKTVVKYYFLYDHQLILTSKPVVEVYKLAKQYGAECALAMVINRETKRKRIIRN